MDGNGLFEPESGTGLSSGEGPPLPPDVKASILVAKSCKRPPKPEVVANLPKANSRIFVTWTNVKESTGNESIQHYPAIVHCITASQSVDDNHPSTAVLHIPSVKRSIAETCSVKFLRDQTVSNTFFSLAGTECTSTPSPWTDKNLHDVDDNEGDDVVLMDPNDSSNKTSVLSVEDTLENVIADVAKMRAMNNLVGTLLTSFLNNKVSGPVSDVTYTVQKVTVDLLLNLTKKSKRSGRRAGRSTSLDALLACGSMSRVVTESSMPIGFATSSNFV